MAAVPPLPRQWAAWDAWDRIAYLTGLAEMTLWRRERLLRTKAQQIDRATAQWATATATACRSQRLRRRDAGPGGSCP